MRLYLDTNCLILFIESKTGLFDRLARRVDDGTCMLFTSELSLAEVLVGAIRDEDKVLEAAYEHLLSGEKFIGVIPIGREILRTSARIRARLGNKTPDSLHVATAVAANCQVFVSSDRRIRLPPEIRAMPTEELDDIDAWN